MTYYLQLFGIWIAFTFGLAAIFTGVVAFVIWDFPSWGSIRMFAAVWGIILAMMIIHAEMEG